MTAEPLAAADARHRATQERVRDWSGPAVGGVVLLAALLRFVTLDDQSLWLDEAYTHLLATSSFGDMLSTIWATENTPPLFFVVTWLLARVTGAADFWLRFVSACAGTALVFAVFRIAAETFDRRAGLYAAWLAAVSPILVWFSQEARSYALAACLSTIALLLFLRAQRDATPRLLAGWAAVSALAAVTHYFAAIPFAVQTVLLLVRVRAHRRHLLIALAAVAPVAGGLAVFAMHQRTVGGAAEIGSDPLAQRVAQVAKQFLVGYDGPAQTALAALAGVLLLVFAGIPLGRRWRAWRDGVPELAIVAVATVAVPVLAALVGVDYLNTRNVLFALPPLLVLAGGGFAAVRPQLVGVVAAGMVGLIGLVTVIGVAANPLNQRPPWRSVAHEAARGQRPAVLVVTPAHGVIPMRAYQPGTRPLTDPVAVQDVVVATVATKTSPGAAAWLPPSDAPVSPGPQFRLVSRHRARAYAVLRFHADAPVQVTPAAAGAAGLGPGAPSVLRVP